MKLKGVERALKALHLAEDFVLISLLGGLVGLAGAQILLRNLFASGLPWADPLLRLTVLWLGLAGALAATREHRHIRIDVIPRLLPDSLRGATDRLTSLFSSLICGVITWHATRLVLVEYEDGTQVAAGIPAWAAELIIPVSFGLMAVRFALRALVPRQPTASK